jgi:hypothetical protein
MYKIPLKDGSPVLEFVTRIPGKRHTVKLDAIIDTGAQFLMIPEKHKNLFGFNETGKVERFRSASGHSLKGTQAIVIIHIKEIGVYPLTAYFYPGKSILFGIRELTRMAKFCVDKQFFYLSTETSEDTICFK